MLSIENPPPDPLCPCEISQLKSSDEKASDNKLALQEVDLLKSGLDDNNNPLPNFSIRDYVFSARSKDIAANWPFSQKKLQLCLKHGVTDLLPPFQPSDSVRNRSVNRCADENTLIDKENISNSDGKPSRPNDQFISADANSDGCNQKLALDCVNINPSGSEGDREFEGNSGPCSALGVDNLLEATAETAVPPASHKAKSPIQPLVKKCRLIVKLSNLTDPSTNEDTMASNACPVCKIFSSSSNTTLNAHIDQCLSGESSTMKWTANAKVIKHRIKPRKTRLMVDIYATAQCCTLEELDRRNGTSWATKSSLPVQEAEVRAEVKEKEKEKRSLTVNVEDTGDAGSVYIDADGTKVRILSKINDMASVSKVGDDPGPRKFLKGHKGSHFLSTKKRKKLHVQKHQKSQKLAPHSKQNSSPKLVRSLEIGGGQERNIPVEENREKEERKNQHFKAQEHSKLDDSGTIRRWVCSNKRTGLAKKSSVKDDYQRSGYNGTKDLLAESYRSSSGDSCMERSCVPKTPNSTENPISYPESSKRMETSSYEPQVDEYGEQPPLKKKVGFSSLGSLGSGYGKRSPVLQKQDSKQMRKEGISVGDSCKDPPSNGENLASSLSNKAGEMNSGQAKNSDGSVVSSKPSWSHRAFSSKVRKFSSLNKNLLSVSQASVPDSKFNFKRKCSALKKSRVHCMSKLDEDAVVWPSEVDQQQYPMQDAAEKRYRMEEITGKTSLGRTTVLKIRKKRGALKISRKEEAVALKSSPTPQRYGHDAGRNMDSSVRVGSALADTCDDKESARKEVQNHGEQIVTELVAVGGSFMSLSKSLDPEFHKLASSPDVRCDLQRCIEVYQGPLYGAEGPICPTEASLGDKQEVYCAGEVGDGMIGQSTLMGAEFDSKDGQGNYFAEVDPIPIPGPPGSFLPSPGAGDMDSEDLQGNSSLTTSRVQSSEDHHDLLDRDSSDSPISATSTVSNPTLAGSDSRSSENLVIGSHAAQDDISPRFSGAGVDSLVENSTPISQAANIGAERTNVDVDELKVNVVFPEKGPLSFKNDQPCCCSRKEGASQGVAFNYQESQLLRRPTTASVSLPAIGKQMSSDPNKKSSTLTSRSEAFSVGNYPSSGPENAVLCSMKSPAGHIPMKASADSEVQYPIRVDCDSPSLSGSNSVFRLMGKNLMLGNKDEDASLQLRQSQSSIHSNPQLCTLSGVSLGNIQNEDRHSFHQVFPQGPNIFSQNQHDTVAQQFDVRFSNYFRSCADLKTPQTPLHASGVMFPNKTVAGGFTASLEQHDYKSGCNLPSERNIPMNKLDTPLTYDMEKVVTTPGPQRRNSNPTSKPIKEIIIIDDNTTDNEDDSAPDAMYNEGMRRSRESSSSISIPMASECDSRHVNPLYSYQLQGSSPYGGSPTFQMPPSRGVNASPVKWNCNPEGPSVLHPSSLTASSSSTGHLRSTFYYSPSFS